MAALLATRLPALLLWLCRLWLPRLLPTFSATRLWGRKGQEAGRAGEGWDKGRSRQAATSA